MKAKSAYIIVSLLIFNLMLVALPPLSCAQKTTPADYGFDFIEFQPPPNYFISSEPGNAGIPRGGIVYQDKDDQSESAGRITLGVQLILPDLSINDIVEAKKKELSKKNNIQIIGAGSGSVGGHEAAIVSYEVNLSDRLGNRVIHAKSYIVPLLNDRKGQTAFTADVLAQSNERLAYLDSHLKTLRIDKENLTNRQSGRNKQR